MKQEDVLTLNTLLRLLFQCYLPQFKNQQELFAAIFASYHEACSETNQCQWLTCQTTVAAILSNRKKKLPRAMQIYYAHNNRLKYIRQDVEEFLRDVLVTAQQREDLYRQLYQLAISCTNLNREDQDYILDCADMPPERKANEILYKMMVIAICNAR